MRRYALLVLIPALFLATASSPTASPAIAAGGWPAPAAADQRPYAPPPTLLVYSTAQQFLAGDLDHGTSIGSLQQALAEYPSAWPVVGVGSTGLPGNGELIVDGSAGDPHLWWADPQSPSQSAVSDLAASQGTDDVDLPFVAVAVADPARALAFTLQDVPDLHVWLTGELQALGLELAGVQVQGSFGPVQTSVAYNVPVTGVDLDRPADYFRPFAYEPADWTMDGIYVAATPLQPLINRDYSPLHLHGYEPGAMVGGHIATASVRSATVTILPLEQLTERRAPQGPAGAGDFGAGW